MFVFSMDFATPVPGVQQTLVVPAPQDSVGYLVLSNTRPADIFRRALQVSATSSTVEQYPLLVDSVTISLLPAPLSPAVDAPSPCASADAPYHIVLSTDSIPGGRVDTSVRLSISSPMHGDNALCSSADRREYSKVSGFHMVGVGNN